MTTANELPGLLDGERKRHSDPAHSNMTIKSAFRTTFSTVGGAIRSVSPTKAAVAVFELLRPEFLSRKKLAPTRIGPTAWLDGLRGVAALSVVFMHMTVYTHPDLELCYGTLLSWGKWNTSPAALPIIRLPFTGGHFSVTLFFTISGYVLPRRLISLLHEGRKDDFVESVNSAIFRRPGRLFLPVIWSTLLLWVVAWYILGIQTPFPPRQDSFVAEAVHWWKEMLEFVYFHRGGMLFTWYNFHSWTIPVELRGSMFIYVWLFATHQMATRPRIIFMFVTMLYLVMGAQGAWYACFFAGMLTSELDLLAAEGNQIKLPWDRLVRIFTSRKRLKTIMLHLLLLFGLFLGSGPSSDAKSLEEALGNCPGWGVLGKMIPDPYRNSGANYRWFWLFWASWMVLVAVKEITWVRWIFESSPAQYLGKHSFALYLVHGPMIGLLSERLFYYTGVKGPIDLPTFVKWGSIHNKWHDASWWFLPDGGPTGLEPNFLLCVAISIPAMLYMAELGTKVFDTPSVKVSSWMWKKARALR